MGRKDAAAWVVWMCASYLRLSQAKTLGALVEAAVRCERISLANLGRRVGGSTLCKHRIKRAWRFIANDRVEPALAMQGVLPRLVRRWPTKASAGRRLLVSLDWTDFRGLTTLVAAANLKGRAIPLVWASCRKHVYDGHRSRNAFEESLLLMLEAALPPGIKPIILADRGFGRTELGRFCQRRGFDYVIRVQGKVTVHFAGQRVRLDRYPIRKGQSELLRNVLYRNHDPVKQHVVVRWKKGLPKRRDEPWYLMTSLGGHKGSRWTARRLTELYAKRMAVEQCFRDHKSKRHGWSLRDTGITDPARLDRLLLILALAMLLLIAVARIARQRFRPSAWCSNQRHNTMSDFRIGQLMLDAIGLTTPLITALARTLANEVPKWG